MKHWLNDWYDHPLEAQTSAQEERRRFAEMVTEARRAERARKLARLLPGRMGQWAGWIAGHRHASGDVAGDHCACADDGPVAHRHAR